MNPDGWIGQGQPGQFIGCRWCCAFDWARQHEHPDMFNFPKCDECKKADDNALYQDDN